MSPIRLLFAAALVLASAAHAQVPEPPLRIDVDLSPNPAPLGAPVAITVTVSNLDSLESHTFGVSGCPVFYEVAGEFAPQWACPEIYTEITVEPGGSHVFSPADYQELNHKADTYPLSPGLKTFLIRVGDLGEVSADLEVLPPNNGLAYLRGRVERPDGLGAPRAQVLFTRSDAAGNAERHQTTTGEFGWFFLGGIQFGEFLMSTPTETGGQWWYPGTRDQNEAEWIYAPPGQVTEPLILVLPGANPPPLDFAFRGRVTAGGQPLAGAAVSAVMLISLVPEWAVPEDHSPAVFSARTGADGEFELPVQPGVYVLIAGKPSQYGFQYWGDGNSWETAEPLEVIPGTDPPERFYEFDLAEIDHFASVVTGRVLGYHPVHDGPPEPLPEVLVKFLPLVPFPEARVLYTKTSSDGTYKFPLPPGTPYRVSFSRDDYFPQWYDQAEHPSASTPLDVMPGGERTGIDALMQPRAVSGFGSVAGTVFLSTSAEDCALPEGCRDVPLAGALVRVSAAYPTFAPYEFTTRTDSLGRFAVDGLAADPYGSLSYYIVAEHRRAAAPGWYPGGVPFPQAEPLPVYPNQTARAGRLLLESGSGSGMGIVAGTVRDLEGEPVPGARVRAYDVSGDSGANSMRTWSARSDANGFYSLRVPLFVDTVVLATAPGRVPGYYSGQPRVVIHYWTQAPRVQALGPTAFGPPVDITLRRQPAAGPYIQAGRVSLAVPGTEVPTLTPSKLAGVGSRLSPRALAQALHEVNLPHSVFYLALASAAGPLEAIVAGDMTGDNGVTVLTDLPQGVYYAYAERPGFNGAYFSSGGAPVPLILNLNTPAVYATIELTPVTRSLDRTFPVSEVMNAPNPFAAETEIHYALETPGRVTLAVFDLQGRLVKRLLNHELMAPGDHTVPWAGIDERGEPAAAGIYFARVTMDGRSTSHKLVLTR